MIRENTTTIITSYHNNMIVINNKKFQISFRDIKLPSWWQSGQCPTWDSFAHLVPTSHADLGARWFKSGLVVIPREIDWASCLTFQHWFLNWFSSFDLTCSQLVLFISVLFCFLPHWTLHACRLSVWVVYSAENCVVGFTVPGLWEKDLSHSFHCVNWFCFTY